jgi:DNA-directed RNA polymerase subunit L
MEIKILEDEKNKLVIELDSVTIAEVLRAYLNKQNVKLAVWKQEHPTKNPILQIESDNPKKSLKDSIAEIQKELDGAVTDFKKLK